jgi:hypothetical protein
MENSVSSHFATALLASAAILAVCQSDRAERGARPAAPAPAIHYARVENLEHVDVALIDSARREIDFAAYVLTDWPIIFCNNPSFPYVQIARSTMCCDSPQRFEM